MHKPLLALLSPLIATFAFAAPPAFAAEDSGASPGAQTTRPPGYKPIEGDAKLGAKLWKDIKLSSNGMSCNACHANHGAFQASFAQPYPHTVQMAKNQLGRKTVHLDEMIQACHRGTHCVNVCWPCPYVQPFAGCGRRALRPTSIRRTEGCDLMQAATYAHARLQYGSFWFRLSGGKLPVRG